MEPKIGIDAEMMAKSAQLLGHILADEMVLYIKTLNYHWNIRGLHFGSLHLFLEKQYEQLSGWVDEIAERIRFLGHNAPGTMQEFLALTQLKEEPKERPIEKEMIKHLLLDQEKIIVHLRKGIDLTAEKYHDTGTSDFLTSLLREHEKMAWMTRAHLEI